MELTRGDITITCNHDYDSLVNDYGQESADRIVEAGIKSAFGSSMGTLIKQGKSQEEIQDIFDNVWKPGMQFRVKMTEQEKAVKKFTKTLEGKSDQEKLDSINALMESAGIKL